MTEYDMRALIDKLTHDILPVSRNALEAESRAKAQVRIADMVVSLVVDARREALEAAAQIAMKASAPVIARNIRSLASGDRT